MYKKDPKSAGTKYVVRTVSGQFLYMLFDRNCYNFLCFFILWEENSFLEQVFFRRNSYSFFVKFFKRANGIMIFCSLWVEILVSLVAFHATKFIWYWPILPLAYDFVLTCFCVWYVTGRWFGSLLIFLISLFLLIGWHGPVLPLIFVVQMKGFLSRT